MYNNKYIDAFPEEEYINILNSPSMMKSLEDEYLNKYNSGCNSFYIAIKESLDHYVSKQIKMNKDYVNSEEFDNYINCIKNISKNNTERFGLKKIYIEPSVNVVFNYLDKETLGKYSSNTRMNIIKNSNKKFIDNIFNKIEDNRVLSDKELSFISMYLDSTKDNRYDKYIEYVFNNLDNIKPNTKILSGIVSYLAKDKNDIGRCIFGSFDRITDTYIPEVNVAHSNPNFDYCVFDIDYFSDIDFNSFDSVKSSRTFESKDILFLIFTAYHELTHQRQKNDVKNNDFRGAALEINNAINSVFKDSYKCNHDASEIEIDADENGWKDTAFFVNKFIDKKLARECIKNSEAVSCRRLFSKKKVAGTDKILTNIEYDMRVLAKAVKERPEIIDNFPSVGKIISKEGAYKTNALFKDIIVDTPAGWEFSNYILNNVPFKFLENKINSGKFSDKEVLNLLNNFIEVPHKNTILIKKLKDINMDTYKETETNVDNYDKDTIYNDFFCECATGFITFNKVLNAANKKFPNTINKNKVSGYNNFYINNYYYEMLSNINNPDMERINRIMNCYDNLDSKELKLISKMTRDYLNKKENKDIEVMFSEEKNKKNKTK